MQISEGRHAGNITAGRSNTNLLQTIALQNAQITSLQHQMNTMFALFSSLQAQVNQTAQGQMALPCVLLQLHVTLLCAATGPTFPRPSLRLVWGSTTPNAPGGSCIVLSDWHLDRQSANNGLTFNTSGVRFSAAGDWLVGWYVCTGTNAIGPIVIHDTATGVNYARNYVNNGAGGIYGYEASEHIAVSAGSFLACGRSGYPRARTRRTRSGW